MGPNASFDAFDKLKTGLEPYLWAQLIPFEGKASSLYDEQFYALNWKSHCF
jgi:hypothetical protein